MQIRGRYRWGGNKDNEGFGIDVIETGTMHHIHIRMQTGDSSNLCNDVKDGGGEDVDPTADICADERRWLRDIESRKDV